MNDLKIASLMIFPLGIMLFSFYLERRGTEPWVIRKYIHTVGLTITAFYGAFLETLNEVLITIFGFLAILILLTFHPRIRALPRLFKMGTRVGEKTNVSMINTTVTMGTALVLLVFLIDFRWIFMAGVLTVAFGDGLGEFIGKPFGKHKYKIIYQKSIEGSIGVFFGSFVGITLSYLLFSMMTFSLVPLFLLISFVTTLIEAISIEFIDNIALPIVTAVMLYYLI